MTTLDHPPVQPAADRRAPSVDGGEALAALYRVAELQAGGADAPAVLQEVARSAMEVCRVAFGAVVLEHGSHVYAAGDQQLAGISALLTGTEATTAELPEHTDDKPRERGAPAPWSMSVSVRAGGRVAGELVVAAARAPATAVDAGFLTTLAALATPAARKVLSRHAGGAGEPAVQAEIAPLLDSLSDAIVLINIDGSLRTANAAYRRLMIEVGLHDERPISSAPALADLRDRHGRPVRPEDLALTRALDGRTTRAERIMRMADGSDRVFALNGSPVLAGDGSVSGVAIVLREITEQIARERALRLMEEVRRGLSLVGDLRRAARAVCRRTVSLLTRVDMAAVYGFDAGELTLLAQAGFASRAARLLAGLQMGPSHRTIVAIRDNRPTIFQADRDEPATEATRRFVAASGAATFVNLPLVAGTSSFGVLTLASRERHAPSRDELALLEALASQIGAELEGVRRREEAEAERSRLQAVLNELPEGVWLLDAAGRLEMSNRGAEAILGRPVDPATPVLGLTAKYGFLHADGRPYLPGSDPIALAFSTGRSVLGEEQIVRRTDGREVPVVSNVAPVRDPAGQLSAVIMVFQDITSLREMDRTKDEFVSIAGHELRTPIAGIRGLAQILLRRGDRLDAEWTRSAIATIAEQTEQMALLVDELLDLSRIRTGRLSLEFAPLNLADVLESAVAGARMQREGIQLTIEDGGQLPVSGDRGRLQQVFGNLLDNALKYSEPATPVEVVARRQQDRVVVEVTDHGIGVSAEDVERIFERFYRAENAALHTGGLGLGLYLCREIVERHGGQIGAAGVPGEGSTFTVTLPLAPGA